MWARMERKYCVCDRGGLTDLWLRNAEERGKHHAGQSRGGVNPERRPGVFRYILVCSAASMLYKVMSSLTGVAA